MAVRLRRAWADVPRWARWVLAVYLIGFADGTADHVRWMTRGGIHAYAQSYPQIAIQVFFVSLVVLDPLVAAPRVRAMTGHLAGGRGDGAGYRRELDRELGPYPP